MCFPSAFRRSICTQNRRRFFFFNPRDQTANVKILKTVFFSIFLHQCCWRDLCGHQPVPNQQPHSYQCDMRHQHNTQQAGTFYSNSLNSWAYVKRRNIDSHLLKLIRTSLPVEEFIEIYRSLCSGLRGSSALSIVIWCYWLSQYFVTDKSTSPLMKHQLHCD